MGNLYEQAPMAKYPWIFCHLSLLLCRLKHGILVKASLVCGHSRFICMDFLYYGWLFEPAKFDASEKTLNNFCRNTSQFLEKYFTVSEEIVQCFFEDV